MKHPIVAALKDYYGIDVSDEMHGTVAEQADKFMEALVIFVQREEKYQDGWRARGWLGNTCDILRKTTRIRSMFWDGDHDPEEVGNSDDVVDLMNYCVFFLRNVDEGNRTGS